MSDADGDFKLVASRRWRGKRSKCTTVRHTRTLPISLTSNCDSGLTDKEAERRVISAKYELSTSCFFSSLQALLTETQSLLAGPVKEILCYGVGHFSECKAARYQFALLLLLGEKYGAEITVYDPVFHCVECRLVENFGCKLLRENEEAKRLVKPDQTTLVYLPHCPKQLTNNFLWANWGPQLHNCVVFSNSFSKIAITQAQRFLVYSASFILDILPYVTELTLASCPEYFNAFNDLSIHVFPISKLNEAAEHFWENREEPVYGDASVEFIRKEVIAKLNVKDV